MTVKDVIYYACVMCGRENLSGQIAEGVIPDDNPEIRKMINCYDLTVMELSENIEPLIMTERLCSPVGEYYFADFSKTPKQILKVEVDGKKVDYTLRPDKMIVSAVECDVTYDYRVKPTVSLSDEVEYDENTFSARVLAMGVAAEYLLVSGLFDEAISWRERYEKAVETYVLTKSKRMKARRWA